MRSFQYWQNSKYMKVWRYAILVILVVVIAGIIRICHFHQGICSVQISRTLQWRMSYLGRNDLKRGTKEKDLNNELY